MNQHRAAPLAAAGLLCLGAFVDPCVAQCGQWNRVQDGPSKVSGHTATYDTWHKRTIICQALAFPNMSFDTWSWNGLSWAMLSPSGPANRSRFPIAFDSARGVIVLHGGDDGDTAQDTWEFDGVKWKEVAYGQGGIREAHTMTYHPIKNRTYLYGGVDNEDIADFYWDTTYAWNVQTKQWDYVDSPVRPLPRAYHVMAYDSWRHVSVMFGGFGSPYPGGPIIHHLDTWEFDGGEWTLRQTSSPFGKRAGATMVFDSRRGVMVLWGGTEDSFRNDMWEWDGSEWTEVDQGTPLPEERSSHAMAYDESRGVIVLFGGQGSSWTLSDTWEYRPCFPDCERDCDLDVFDYLCFLDKFVHNSPYCDFERDGDNDIFDFLKFQDEFVNGCG